MKFTDVTVFSGAKEPVCLTVGDEPALFIWFETRERVWLMTESTWIPWKKGYSIAESLTASVMETDEEFPNTGGLPDGFKCLKCSAEGDALEEVACTKEEINSRFNCGRSYACCCVALVCKTCGTRIRAGRAAPEWDWDYGGTDE